MGCVFFGWFFLGGTPRFLYLKGKLSHERVPENAPKLGDPTSARAQTPDTLGISA